MDVTSLLEVKPAPRAVFDRLPTHRDRARFHVRKGDGWEPVTWGTFARQIRGVAKWLLEHHIEAGERVAIMSFAISQTPILPQKILLDENNRIIPRN